MLRFGEWRIRSDSATPREVVLELTTDCNMGCSYCFRRALGVEATYMDRSLALEVVEQCSRLGIEKILFSGWGEPTLHPSFSELLWRAREAGLEVSVNTNGSKLEELARDLVEAGVSEVIVSLDAFDYESYEKLRGFPAKKVLGGLEQLLNEKISRGRRRPKLVVHFVATRLNVEELAKFPEFARRYSVSKLEVSHLIPIDVSMEKNLSCLRDPRCVEALERSLNELGKYMFSHYFEVSVPRNRPSVERRCPYAHAQATFVGVDGSISPCLFYAHRGKHSFDEIERRIERVVFGHVLEGIDAVWRNPEYVSFRARAALSLMPSCLDCPLAQYCEPTLTNERDCWGNAPTCSHCPFSHRIAVCPL